MILPLVIDRLGDPKEAVRVNSANALDSYYLTCPDETEEALRQIGFTHSDSSIRLACIGMVQNRIREYEKFSFKLFTAPVTTLLLDDNSDVRTAAYNLLTGFFRTASSIAKQALQNELYRQSVPQATIHSLLRDIGPGSASRVPPIRGSAAAASHAAPTERYRAEPARPTGRITVTPVGYKVPDHHETTDVPSGDGEPDVSFVTKQPGAAMDHMEAEHIDAQSFETAVEDCFPYFEGKETEHNWSHREKTIVWLRKVLRGSLVEQSPKTYVWALKHMSDGISKGITSLRTTLATNSMQLIKEAAITLGSQMDTAIEPFLSHLVKISAGAKRITAQMAAMVVNVLIINTSFSMRYVFHINSVMGDKVAPAKAYSTTWMRLIFLCHRKAKHQIDHAGGSAILEKCVAKALVDANPSVREGARQAYWTFHAVWPQQAATVMSKLDATSKKALERSAPKGAAVSASTSVSARPQPIRDYIGRVREARSKEVPRSAAAVAGARLGAGRPVGRPARPGYTSAATGRRLHPAAAPSHRDGQDYRRSTSSTPTFEHSPAFNDQDAPSEFPSQSESRASSALSYSRPDSAMSAASDEFQEDVSSKEATPVPEDDHSSVEKGFSDAANVTEIPKPLAPTAVELLESEDATQFAKGAEALSLLMRGKEPDSETCRSTALPPPEVVRDALQRIFADDNSSSGNHVRAFIKPDIVGSVLQFVTLKVILTAAIRYEVGADELESSLNALEPLVSSTCFGVVSDLVLLVAEQQDQSLLPPMARLLDRVPEFSAVPESAAQLSRVLSFIEDGPSRQVLERVASRARAKPVEQTSTDDVEQEQVADSVSAVEMAVDSDGDHEAESKPVSADMADAAPQSAPEEEQQLDTKMDDVESGDDDGTLREGEDEDEMTADVTEQVGSEESDPTATVTVNLEALEIQAASEDQTKDEMQEEMDNAAPAGGDDAEIGAGAKSMVASVSPVKNNTQDTSATSEIAMAQNSPTKTSRSLLQSSSPKVAIFQDNDETPPSVATTPTKLKEKGQENGREWYEAETKHVSMYQPLPDTETEATALYQSLLHQMKSRTIDAHGCRRLVSIVRREPESSDAAFLDTWKKGAWSLKFQQAVVDCVSDPELDVSQLRTCWLLITQFLLTDTTSFEGYKKRLAFGLVSLASRLEWKNLGEKLPGQVCDALLPTCTSPASRIEVFDGLLAGYDEFAAKKDGTCANNVLYFTLASLKKTIDRARSGDELSTSFTKISNMATDVIGTNDLPHARRLGYLLLVSIKQKLASSPGESELDELVSTRLGPEQQKFFDAILAKLTT